MGPTRTLGQYVPGDGVGDGREDPVELPQGRLAVVLAPRDLVDHIRVKNVLQQRARAEPDRHKRDGDGILSIVSGSRMSFSSEQGQNLTDTEGTEMQTLSSLTAEGHPTSLLNDIRPIVFARATPVREDRA